MRATIHLVSAADCLLLRPLMQPVLDAELAGTRIRRRAAHARRRADRRLRALAARRAAVDGVELRAALAERFPEVDAPRSPTPAATSCRSSRYRPEASGARRRRSGRRRSRPGSAVRSTPGVDRRRRPPLPGRVRACARRRRGGVVAADRLPRGRRAASAASPDVPRRAGARAPRSTRGAAARSRHPRPGAVPARVRQHPALARRSKPVHLERDAGTARVRYRARSTARCSTTASWSGCWRLDLAVSRATLVVNHAERLTKRAESAIAAEGRRLLRFLAAEADGHDVRFAAVS